MDIGLLIAICVVYWVGGENAAWSVFVGIPVALIAFFLLLFAYGCYKEPEWTRQRHEYLREKRRKMKSARNGG